MREIDDSLKQQILAKVQNDAQKNRPRMRILATRPRTALFDANFLSRSIVTPNTTITDSSLATRKTGETIERVYVGYISGSVLVVKSAVPKIPSSEMVWDLETTIQGCKAVALAFDGQYLQGEFKKVDFLTAATPWLFYLTTSGDLYAGLLGATYERLVQNVTAMDAVKGVTDRYVTIDQGLLLFYIIAGLVYYKQFVNGVWSDPIQVTMAPSNAVDVHVSRVFDYRIVLQIRTTAGDLYEVFTKMESSSWNGTEYLRLMAAQVVLQVIPIAYTNTENRETITLEATATIDNILLAIPAEMQSAINIDNGSGDFTKKVQITWNQIADNVAANLASFELSDSSGQTLKPTGITHDGNLTSVLTFTSIAYSNGHFTLTYTPGTISNVVGPTPQHSVDFDGVSLPKVGQSREYLAVTASAVVSNILIAFPNYQAGVEYLSLSSVSAVVSRINTGDINT